MKLVITLQSDADPFDIGVMVAGLVAALPPDTLERVVQSIVPADKIDEILHRGGIK